MKLKKITAIVLSCLMLLEPTISMAETGTGYEQEEGNQESIETLTPTFFYVKNQEGADSEEDIVLDDQFVLTQEFPQVLEGESFNLTLGSKDDEGNYTAEQKDYIIYSENATIQPIAESVIEGQVYNITPLKPGELKITAHPIDNEEEIVAEVLIEVVEKEEQPSQEEEIEEQPDGEQSKSGTNSIKDIIMNEEVTSPKIELNHVTYDMYVGKTVQLTAQVTPEEEVIWESEDPTIATVTGQGLVTALKQGSVLIKAKVGEEFATCKINVLNPTIKLNKSSISLYKGETATLTATAVPEEKVTYRSSSTSIAKVDSNGKITAVKAGTAQIYASANGIETACKVTVLNPTIALNYTSTNLYIGYPITLKATLKPGGQATYKSSNTKIVTVDKNGKLTGKTSGEATITVTANGVSKKCTVKVRKPSITLVESKLVLFEKNTYKLTTTSKPDKPLSFKSSNKKVATVDKNGILTGVKAGKATITITLGSATKKCNLTVLKNDYKLNKSSKTLTKGATVKLFMNNISSDAGGHVKYSIAQSSGNNIVSLSSKNNVCTVKGLNPGKAVINATYYYYHGGMLVACTNSVNITVKNEGILQQQISIAAGTKKQLKLKNAGKSGKTIQKTTWSSSNKNIVTVNSTSGLITGKKKGNAKVTAKVKYSDNTTVEFVSQIKVSNPKVKQKVKVASVNTQYKVGLTGLNSYSDITWKSSKSSVASVTPDGRVITKQKTGTAIISATIDGKKVKHEVQVSNPKLKEAFTPLALGSSSKIKMSGVVKKSKVKYKSQNKRIATVNSKGQVKAKGRGTTRIEVTADGKKLYFEVNVGSKKAVSAIHKAKSIMYSSTYSQPYRMSTGYYDCSSLTYRAMQPNASSLLGGGSGWAPTAAAQAQFLESRGKVISYTGIDVSMLQPGDLIFYGGNNNGRYKGIYHVSMYYGGGLRIEKPMRKYYPEKSIVMIARPTK